MCSEAVRRKSVEQVPVGVEPPMRSVLEAGLLVQGPGSVLGDVLHDSLLIAGLSLLDVDNRQPGPGHGQVVNDVGTSARMPGCPQVLPAVQDVRGVARPHEGLGSGGPAWIVQNWSAAPRQWCVRPTWAGGIGRQGWCGRHDGSFWWFLECTEVARQGAHESMLPRYPA